MPGSFELPVVAKSMAKSGAYDAIVCIGAVVRQSPSHRTLRMLDQADSAQNQHCSPLQPGHGSASVRLTVLTFPCTTLGLYLMPFRSWVPPPTTTLWSAVLSAACWVPAQSRVRLARWVARDDLGGTCNGRGRGGVRITPLRGCLMLCCPSLLSAAGVPVVFGVLTTNDLEQVGSW